MFWWQSVTLWGDNNTPIFPHAEVPANKVKPQTQDHTIIKWKSWLRPRGKVIYAISMPPRSRKSPCAYCGVYYSGSPERSFYEMLPHMTQEKKNVWSRRIQKYWMKWSKTVFFKDSTHKDILYANVRSDFSKSRDAMQHFLFAWQQRYYYYYYFAQHCIGQMF